jgi:hypothetical protein
MASHAPAGPYKLVTVNTAPERAKVIIGRVMEAVKERYRIDYVANAESMAASFICLFFGWFLLRSLVSSLEDSSRR